jgi:formylglycine-generating enzyme
MCFEWVSDRYDASYYASSPYTNPSGPDAGEQKGLRGGGWNAEWDLLRVAIRKPFVSAPMISTGYIGFRCAVGE